MSLLYLECNMGAAGDMLAAALYELCTDAQKQEFVRAMDTLRPRGVALSPQRVTVCGIAATHMAVTVHGQTEGHTHAAAQGEGCHAAHSHPTADSSPVPHATAPSALPAHGCHFTHAGKDSCIVAHPDADAHRAAIVSPSTPLHQHAAPAHIAALLNSLALPSPVRAAANAVYARIAQAESRAHGVAVANIHFHEVGALDAVADVTAVCLLAHLLAPDAVVVSPIATGSGTVRCAHGILPVPAPATAYLLEGVPTWAGSECGELCTPTGAALLRQLATEYGAMPAMTVEKIGCGAGTKPFATANLVRAFWGTPTAAKTPTTATSPLPNESICELACNLDDASAEEIGFALMTLLEAGALDAYTTPIGMKKSRNGLLLTALCRPSDADRLAALLFQSTPTLGVRRTEHARYALARSRVEVDTPYGVICVKTAHGYGVSKTKPEYDDVAAAASRTGASFAQVRRATLAAFDALRQDSSK